MFDDECSAKQAFSHGNWSITNRFTSGNDWKAKFGWYRENSWKVVDNGNKSCPITYQVFDWKYCQEGTELRLSFISFEHEGFTENFNYLRTQQNIFKVRQILKTNNAEMETKEFEKVLDTLKARKHSDNIANCSISFEAIDWSRNCFRKDKSGRCFKAITE